MKPKTKLEVLPTPPRAVDPVAHDAFHEDRLRRDLARVAGDPSLFTQILERSRIRLQKSSERAVLNRWTEPYSAGERLIAAKTAMERKRSEYLQLAREHEIRETEKAANIAKLKADIEEHGLRLDKTTYQRQHPELFIEDVNTASISENRKKIAEAEERRDLDSRWELRESLRALRTLIELQHWRRQERDRILKDPALTSEEQAEDLQFVDELFHQKRAELKVDTRIFDGQS